MEWHLLTPFVKEIEEEQGEGLSLTHPLIPLVCVSGWNGIHSLPSQKREREREREQGDAIHPLTPLVYESGWNGIHSLSL